MKTESRNVEIMPKGNTPALSIAGRSVGRSCNPLVIAEIGINHEGSFEKAVRMVEEAARAGCECVKFQAHVIEDEMIPNDVIPAMPRKLSGRS
jgi:sialic acid synthase SpsE